VFADGQTAVRGSLDSARSLVARRAQRDSPLRGALPADIWTIPAVSSGSAPQLVEHFPAQAAPTDDERPTKERPAGEEPASDLLYDLAPRRQKHAALPASAVGAGIGAVVLYVAARRIRHRLT
jgi:hypothetical protein